MPPLTDRIAAFTKAPPALWIGTLMSSMVGLLFFLATAKGIENDSRTRFANHARNAQNTVVARIKSYTDMLRATASLFQTTETLTRTQFRDFVDGLLLAQHYPAIATLNFAQYVREQDRPDFLRRMRAEYPTESGGAQEFQLTPAGTRAHYSVLTLIEPEGGWNNTLGFDLNANPNVGDALLAARDSGKLVSTGTPILAISAPNNVGLGMRMPVYHPHRPLGTVSERRAAYRGSVGIAFSVNKLVQGVRAELPISNVRMTLVDSGTFADENSLVATPHERVLFDSSGTGRQPAPPLDSSADSFSITLPIDFNGRPWKATFSTPKSGLLTRFDALMPWLAMLGGSVGSMLVYALLQSLTSSRRRALVMAKSMTRELRDSQAKLQLSHENLRRLAAHADHIKEGERKRIAREIHDDLGQNLLVLRMEADMLSSRTGGRHPRLHARAQATLSQIDATIKSVRQIINDLRPNVLDLGLSAAVEWQVGEFRRRTGIDCELADDHQADELDDRYATAFFRILQESLSNIARHAAASAVKVELKLQAVCLSMTISDNGVGLPADGRHKTGSFGLVGIEERIHLLGGCSSILSFPGAGTTVYVAVPVVEQAAQAQAEPGTANA